MKVPCTHACGLSWLFTNSGRNTRRVSSPSRTTMSDTLAVACDVDRTSTVSSSPSGIVRAPLLAGELYWAHRSHALKASLDLTDRRTGLRSDRLLGDGV